MLAIAAQLVISSLDVYMAIASKCNNISNTGHMFVRLTAPAVANFDINEGRWSYSAESVVDTLGDVWQSYYHSNSDADQSMRKQAAPYTRHPCSKQKMMRLIFLHVSILPSRSNGESAYWKKLGVSYDVSKVKCVFGVRFFCSKSEHRVLKPKEWRQHSHFSFGSLLPGPAAVLLQLQSRGHG